jgi:hypothetical protein
MVVALRLEPFTFQSPAGHFGWLPFRSYLGGSLSVNTRSFFEKFFFYGSLIWIGQAAGLRLPRATLMVAAMLFATSLAEVYLPGRSAEITDAVMALVAGGIIAMLSGLMRERQAGAAQRGRSAP